MSKLKRISILGLGWLGLPLANQLVKNGFRVKGSATSNTNFKNFRIQKIDPFLIDLNNLNESILEFFLESDVLIFAVPPSKINIEKLEYFVELVEKSDVRKVIVISSTGIYRESNCEIIEKNANEFLVKNSMLNIVESLFNESLIIETTVLQLGGLIGYDRPPAKYAKSPKILSNPNGRINLIHRDDAIKLIEEVINQNCWGETFMCCSDQHPTKKEFYTQAAIAAGEPEPVFENVTNDQFKIINNQKVKEKLKFEFVDLFDTL